MKKSRIIAMLLAAAMVLSMIVLPEQVVAADDQYTMRLVDESGNDSIVAEPGDLVVLYLTIENNPGIIGVGTYIGYDSDALTLDWVEDEKLFDDVADVAKSKSPDLSVNPYYVTWLMATGTAATRRDPGGKLITTEGDLLYLEFVVADDAAPGEYEITLDVNSNTTIKNANITSDVDDDGVLVPGAAYSIFDGSETALVTVGFTVVIEGEEAPTECTHSYTNYVSDGNATCEADGTKTATCDKGCGATDTVTDEGSKLDHSYTSYTSNGDATCTADGTKTATCDHGCGTTDTIADTGSATGHNFQGEWYYETDPSCTADGVRYQLCSVCGAKSTAEVEEGSKLTHSFTNYVSNGDATCTADGTKTATCDHGCGATDTVTDEGSALGHDFKDYVSNNDATCTEDGTITGTCDRCGETATVTDEGSALGHDFKDYVSNNDATCENDGTITGTCDRCGETATVADEGSALGHDFGEYVSNNDATCEADGTKTADCSRCDATDTVADVGSALGHSHTNYVSDGNATCTEDGTKTATCDHGCGTTDTIADTGSALGHDMDEVKANPATCTEAGNKVYYVCSRCNKAFKDVNGDTETTVEAETLPALGHKYSDYVSNNDATCEADGTKTATCDHGCGTTDTVTDEGTALGHSYTNYVSNNDATCEADGTKTATCDHGCGTTDTKADEGTALGHKYTNYVSDGNATCLEDGTKTATCDNGCGKTHTVTDEGTALGHDYQAVTVDPTCTEKGYTGEKCSRCDDVIVTEEIDALGHTEGEAVVENKVEPTCEAEGGYDMVVRCTVCGEIITSTHYTVDALGHELLEHAAVEATEDAAGNIHYFECESCGKLYAADKTTEITLADTVIEKLTPAPTEEPESNGSAETGDSTHLALALAVMLVACMGTAVVVTVRKRFGN